MRRITAVVLGLLLWLSAASVGLAAPPGPTLHQISISLATTDVSAACIGTGSPCDGTVRLTFTGTIAGQQPFSDIKGVKDPQTVVGTFDFPMSMYDSGTGCFSGVTGLIQFFVPQGSRLAFSVVSADGSGCGAGAFSAAFAVDSNASEMSIFRNATGSGQLNVSSDLDLENITVSAVTFAMSGEITVSR